jgi:hypothetical protein
VLVKLKKEEEKKKNVKRGVRERGRMCIAVVRDDRQGGVKIEEDKGIRGCNEQGR